MLQTIPNFEAKIKKGVYFTLFCAKSCFFCILATESIIQWEPEKKNKNQFLIQKV